MQFSFTFLKVVYCLIYQVVQEFSVMPFLQYRAGLEILSYLVDQLDQDLRYHHALVDGVREVTHENQKVSFSLKVFGLIHYVLEAALLLPRQEFRFGQQQASISRHERAILYLDYIISITQLRASQISEVIGPFVSIHRVNQ